MKDTKGSDKEANTALKTFKSKSVKAGVKAMQRDEKTLSKGAARNTKYFLKDATKSIKRDSKKTGKTDSRTIQMGINMDLGLKAMEETTQAATTTKEQFRSTVTEVCWHCAKSGSVLSVTTVAHNRCLVFMVFVLVLF